MLQCSKRTFPSVGGSPLARSRRTATQAFVPDASILSVADHLHTAHHLLASDALTPTVAHIAQPIADLTDGGPIDTLAKLFESTLTGIDSILESAHIPYSYGFSIVLLTLLVKVATYPLTKKQVESTMATQALQPMVKELQAKHANDPERLQLETARLYKEAQVNPLAGCLPALATIPVFIGLYRALTLASQDGLLKEGFFFVPSLGGPATVQQQLDGKALEWLFPFINGQPPLGWGTTAQYLALPILLVISQYASIAISSPKTDDPAMQQTQTILKVLPFMIGWFSLTVPAGMTVYWLTNNVLTTAQQVYLKKTVKVETPKLGGGTFRKSEESTPGVIDVDSEEVSSADGSSRRSRKGEKFRARKAAQNTATIAKNARGKKKGSKFAERSKKQAEELASSANDAVIDVGAEVSANKVADSQPEPAKSEK